MRRAMPRNNTTVPGRERVTTLRQSSTSCIASRSTRPTAWLRKCVVAKVNRHQAGGDPQALRQAAPKQDVHLIPRPAAIPLPKAHT